MRLLIQRLMNRKGPPLWIAGMLVLLSAGARAQQTCSLSMDMSHTAVQQLSLADVDFEHFQGINLLFTINLTNRSDDPVEATLHLTIDVALADNSGDYPSAVELTTKKFQVPHEGKTITNLNLGRSGDIKTEAFQFEDAAKSKLQDGALATGHLPAGTYKIKIMLAEVGCDQQPISDYVTIILQNPSQVVLRSPRDGEVTGEFPLFEFYQESDRAVLIVAEMTSGQSREDAIVRQPPMLEAELSGQNSFLYSGGRPLQDGKTYVWRVVSKVRSSGGTDIDVSSPIGEFTVSASPQGSAGDALLNQLEEMLGSRYHAVFTQIRNSGFKLTENFTLNNSTLTRSELLDLLNQLRELGDSVELSLE